MTHAQGDYDTWASLYDETLGPDYCREKLGFLERNLIPGLPPGARVLDLCCGTGQLIVPLLERGYAVTGLDGSADMLRHARRNAPAATFVQADARDFAFEAPFDGVLCTSASLNHMPSLDDLGRVFACVAACLRPGGVFVFDLNHPAQLQRHWRGQPAEGDIRPDHAWLITPRYDPATRAGAFTVDIWRRPGDETTSTAFPRMLCALLGVWRFRRLRRRMLARFSVRRPSWQHRAETYPIHGHDLSAVTALLDANGLAARIETVGGDRPLDEDHAAHFVCTKRAAATTSAATAPIAETGASR
ncbi:class I SAM-dependent methyltransferase [Methylobrevis pamukkalensis]|uniref:dTDP-3-amino-3,4, 6-trideoxy-alpha-D-glucopyranose n=1 Tax=Methylobrevis pamukkalensis TaxID=1439726 RepID=A0A1E3H770_9HYPH|nr:class I SAM-dependent methyltransferase [Methylobrevis pamukkalensis]ODN72177.1 dTDP-3-amino-3,4,6-trideoxy-alpha-D-glucopyranose [Methylobrevis pamukkalensis]